MSAVVLRAGAATDVGRLRPVNQDRFALLPDRNLFVVADGMGGHQGGEVASRLAVETLQVAYQEATAEALHEAIDVANHRIRNEGDADPALRGMGTTLVALALLADDDADDPASPRILVANVGDSRCYLLRDGSLTQLTEDHSVVADLVRDGSITAAEAEAHPQRNIVTRVLGIYETVAVDLWPIDPLVHDRYLLCSDGLFNEVGADQMSSVLRRLDDPSEAAAELVRLANQGGGRDNITAVVVDVLADGGVAEAASAALIGDATSMAGGAIADVSDVSDDPAGFTTATPAVAALDAAAPSPVPRVSRRARRAQQPPRTRITWRVIGFVVLLAVVIGGAFATIQWYGTSTYFVSFAGDELVIYQGRPGGVLWLQPVLEERTGIQRSEVPERNLSAIIAGNEQPTLAKARQQVANIQRDIAAIRPSATSTTTTSTTATTATTVQVN